MLAVTAVLAAFAPSAKAGTYPVPFCDRSASRSIDGWTDATTTGSSPYFLVDKNCTSGGMVYRRFELWAIPAGASDDWVFDAPQGTYINRFDIYQEGAVRSAGAGHAIYSWRDDGARTVNASWVPGQALSDQNITFPVAGSKVIRLQDSLYCNQAANCPGTDPNGFYGNEQIWRGAVVWLVDPSVPTFNAVSGDGWTATPADGRRRINFSVSDSGSGVKEARFYLDGVRTATSVFGCVAESKVPCPATADGSFTFDTTRLSEGQHDLRLELDDGSMNPASKQLSITVRRPPHALDPTSGGSPVAVTNTTTSGGGAPAVGDQLHGSNGAWAGDGLSFTYQWMRCAADGTACLPIPGATGVNYTPTSADIGRTLQFCVTASNSGGSATSCSAPTAAVVASRPSTSTGGGTVANPADTAERPGETVKPSASPTTPTSTQAVDRGAPNGSPAADKVVLTALINNRSSTMKVKFGKRVPIGGKLVGPDGTPIANAILEVQTRTSLPGASVADAGKVVTGSDGRFSYVAPAGPSRVVRIAYRSHSADSSFADTSDVTLLVKAGVTIKATPKKVRNRHATIFTGRLLGKPISKRGVVVDLQVFFRHKWRTFGAPRTNRAGKYRFKYRFMAGAATWKFRARVRRETSYPFIEGYSAKTIKVKVVN
ncbi:MAG TPA: hypothetical protein VF066_13835 [Thermoleophilaceae bacterium]